MDLTGNDVYSIFRCSFLSYFFTFIYTILSKMRDLKLLTKCWYLIIPRRCLKEDIRETSASKGKTHEQGVHTRAASVKVKWKVESVKRQ